MADSGDSTMRVSKNSVQIVAIVDRWRIEGCLHVLAGSRLTDALNSKAKDFLAVTDARIYEAASGSLVSGTPFLAINRESISLIFLNE